jgi:hypothetical protein
MAAYPEFAERLVIKLIGLVRHATRQIKGLALDGVYERMAVLLPGSVTVCRGDDTRPKPTKWAKLACVLFYSAGVAPRGPMI